MTYNIIVTQPETPTISVTQPEDVSVSVAQPNVVNVGGGAAYDDTALKQRISAIEAQETTWNGKQNAISDLATIRSGAALGATALQESDVSEMRTKVGTLYADYLSASEVVG